MCAWHSNFGMFVHFGIINITKPVKRTIKILLDTKCVSCFATTLVRNVFREVHYMRPEVRRGLHAEVYVINVI
jgi:hypothetical protein